MTSPKLFTLQPLVRKLKNDVYFSLSLIISNDLLVNLHRRWIRTSETWKVIWNKKVMKIEVFNITGFVFTSCGATAWIRPRPPHTHTHTRARARTVRLLWTSDQSVAEVAIYTIKTRTQQINIHALSGIRTRDPNNQVAADLRLKIAWPPGPTNTTG
jgi:hypothetical protein